MTYTPTDSRRTSAAISFMSSSYCRRRGFSVSIPARGERRPHLRGAIRMVRRIVRHLVTQLNHPVLELLDRKQLQRHLPMTPRDQRYAIANEHRGYGDHELVDRALVEEGRD